MPFGFKRSRTPFGEMIHKRGPVGTNLLITRKGEKLRMNFKKLLSSVKVIPEGNTDRVVFFHGFQPKEIGYGGHGLLFIITPKSEAAFSKRFAKANVHRHSAALKVYRESISKAVKPDGFTQYFANLVVGNHLRKIPDLGFSVRPLSVYFVSEKLTVRRFIRAPTLAELREYFVDPKVRRKPISKALSDKEIAFFVEKNRISKAELNQLIESVQRALAVGEKANFGLGKTGLKIVSDPSEGNFFFVGRGLGKEPIIEIIDQGREPIPGLGDMIRKGRIFSQK